MGRAARQIGAGTIIASLGLVPVAVGTGVQAQEGGPRLTFGVNQRLEISDNPDLVSNPSGLSAVAVTSLSFGLSSRTRTDTLSFGANTDIYAGDTARAGDINVPALRFGYIRDTEAATIRTDASWSRVDLDTVRLEFSPVEDEDSELPDTVEVTVLPVTGTRNQMRIGSSLTFGKNRPAGATANIYYSSTDYSDTGNPDLYDRDEIGGGLTGRLDVNDVLSFSPKVTASHYEAENAAETERDRLSFGVGATYRTSPIMTLKAEVAKSRVETTEFGGPADVNDGLTGSLGFERQLPNGLLGASLDRALTDDGKRTTVSVRGKFALPDDDSWGFTVGMTETTDTDWKPLLSLDYTRTAPQGTLRVALTQQATEDDNSQERITTRLSAAYQREVTERSSLTASAGLSAINRLEGGTDENRLDLGLGYSYELAEDWSLTSGYRFARTDSSTGSEATSNTVYVGIGKTFSIRP